MTSNEDELMSYDGLVIERGARHCKILNEEGEVEFRTTNLRDAQRFLELLEERDRLQKLLDSRGIAPHRIYLLAAEEEKRGRVNLEGAPAKEVVIVAKSEDNGLVVRSLADGKEEIVDMDELEAIEGGPYLQASEVQDETMLALIRYDREAETAHLALFRTQEGADEMAGEWAKVEENPGTEYQALVANSEGDVILYRAEATVED